MTVCNTVLIMNIPDKVDDLLYPLIAFAGVMMSLRLRASMMKVVTSFFPCDDIVAKLYFP
ncbi:hypothetical protein OL548_13370 [Lysinibacillus sp. MHQ-1]|nr:hypothetical protein OL548_13370 [Lysinibacillus sp. MHQ-1]